jgi:glycerophosphoryl diester phosphodiesterase
VAFQLLRADGPVVRVGHRGAPRVAPENTLESLAAAIELGVDAVELDVIARGDGRLVLAHSADAAAVPAVQSLDEALAFLASLDTGVLLDLKGRGHERELAAALRGHGLLGRAFVSTPSPASLRALRTIEPALPLALTYPDDRFGLTGRRLVRPAVAPALAAMRRSLPVRLPRRLRRVGARAASLNWTVVSPAVVDRCHALGVAVYAWTVNDRRIAEKLVGAGVDGIITDDPRILEGPLTT